MHNHMIIDIDEAVELTKVPEKITAIIPSSQAPIECLLWTVFSLLIRTRVKDHLEHFAVVLNGPDKRTGNETICDQKQKFLEELRQLKWWNNLSSNPKHKRDMPITVIRVWSRIGHPEAVEMVIPWVHTDSYLIMHDDIIIMFPDWIKQYDDVFFNDQNVAIAWGQQRIMCAGQDAAVHNGKNLLRFPHLLCCFLLCRKKHMAKLGSNWCGYSINTPPFKLEEQVDKDEFNSYYRKLGVQDKPLPEDITYEYISMEMGAWHYYNIVQAGLDIVPIKEHTIQHLGTMSWECDTGKVNRINLLMPAVRELEAELCKQPEFWELYNKYLPKEYHDKRLHNDN